MFRRATSRASLPTGEERLVQKAIIYGTKRRILTDDVVIHMQIMLDFDARGHKIRRTFQQTQGCRHDESSL